MKTSSTPFRVDIRKRSLFRASFGQQIPPLLPTNLQIPVLFIPSNNGTIPSTTPGTIINVVNPEVTVSPIGTVPPGTIPLNSLTPTVFNQTPVLVEVPTITNSGTINTSNCF